MNAASVFGGGAVRKDLPILLRVVLGITVVLVAFSRIYLGVHTPQDILVGTVAGTLVMWLTARLMQWLGAHPEKDLLIAGIGIGLALARMIITGQNGTITASNRDGGGACFTIRFYKSVV